VLHAEPADAFMTVFGLRVRTRVARPEVGSARPRSPNPVSLYLNRVRRITLPPESGRMLEVVPVPWWPPHLWSNADARVTVEIVTLCDRQGRRAPFRRSRGGHAAV